MTEVVIFTSDNCSSCKAVKEELNALNIDYYEKNISKNPEFRNELIKMGYTIVPVTIVCNENEVDSYYVLGNDIDRIKKHIHG